jgi:hypothetical protein
MPAVVAGIHVFRQYEKKGVDGRDAPGHDSGKSEACARTGNFAVSSILIPLKS